MHDDKQIKHKPTSNHCQTNSKRGVTALRINMWDRVPTDQRYCIGKEIPIRPRRDSSYLIIHLVDIGIGDWVNVPEHVMFQGGRERGNRICRKAIRQVISTVLELLALLAHSPNPFPRPICNSYIPINQERFLSTRHRIYLWIASSASFTIKERQYKSV